MMHANFLNKPLFWGVPTDHQGNKEQRWLDFLIWVLHPIRGQMTYMPKSHIGLPLIGMYQCLVTLLLCSTDHKRSGNVKSH